ncbi:hypothetical protein KUC_2736 [Vreelandella boliviensis LC1]|uniref:Uncharacterized protein n=1 Tax=Vreelandella boliviensis LC1 TaxID=1072583 RepID=A0A7U9C0B2_9GAMM|nr:hypothetical protein KUC_2736 [Halomonas boliviensis LC1]
MDAIVVNYVCAVSNLPGSQLRETIMLGSFSVAVKDVA